jgi:hypothetical protein
VKSEKFTSAPINFLFFLCNRGFICTFATDKSIKLSFAKKYD